MIQYLHFKTQAGYDKQLAIAQQAGTLHEFQQAIACIDEGPVLYLHGQRYNCRNTDLIPITYNELCILKNNCKLVPNTQYRLIDYETTVSGNTYKSAGHKFDLIITSLSDRVLNSQVSVIHHDDDTYFRTSDLGSWRVWYSLEGGLVGSKPNNFKGHIYRMVDEFGNDCPYDFKNILWSTSGLDIEFSTDWCYTFTSNDGLDLSLTGNNVKSNRVQYSYKQLRDMIPTVIVLNNNNLFDNTISAGTQIQLTNKVINSFVLGTDCKALHKNTLAEGEGTIASGASSHAEGLTTTASGANSHSEGISTIASGKAAHAEGESTSAVAYCTHAEGYQTVAGSTNGGKYSHAEGYKTQSLGNYAHAEGSGTYAYGTASHAAGICTTALNPAEVAIGQYNLSTQSDNPAFATAFSIGNGTSTNKSNIFEIKANGDIYSNNNKLDLTSIKQVLPITAYRSSATKPETPVGGMWINNNSQIEVSYPTGWSSLDDISDSPVWTSTSVQSENGEFILNWSSPVQISGKDGTIGQDGDSVQFIYQRTKDVTHLPSNPTVDSGTGIDNWTEDPMGISVDYLAEWICSRIIHNGVPGTWSTPALWAKWGTDGKDGNSVEYIYYRNNGEVPTNPTPTDYLTNSSYQTDGYCNEEMGWYDNPHGVNTTYTCEWVCVRKYKDGVWLEFSDPALWSKYGEHGDDGISLRTLYAAWDIHTSAEDIANSIQRNNINPGSNWSLVVPDSTNDNWIWSITAYVRNNTLVEVSDANGDTVSGWQGPILVTGKGKDAETVNYPIYVYANNYDLPTHPTITNANSIVYPIDNVWLDCPNSSESITQWWQCIGIVDGTTKDITWGKVIPLNGQDGIAKDGKVYETRLAIGLLEEGEYVYPEFIATYRNPGDEWVLANQFTVPNGVLAANQCVFQTTALIDYADSVEGILVNTWSTPFKISGETGPIGKTGPTGDIGPNGLTGVPGVDFIAKYCVGGILEDGTEELKVEKIDDYFGEGWYDKISEIPEADKVDYPYIYCVQGRVIYIREEADEFTQSISWDTPFRLTGTAGLDGVVGQTGQIVYPAGIYDPYKLYTADDYKAPYDYDPSDKCYYVLNIKNSADFQGWLGCESESYPDIPSQNCSTPSESYINFNNQYWQKIANFEAIYSDIGIFGNALVGSAVFNGDFMFSQQGVNLVNQLSTNYEKFATDFQGNLVTDENGNILPYATTCLFRPSCCINLKTGQAYYAYGNIVLNDSESSDVQTETTNEKVPTYARIGNLVISNNSIFVAKWQIGNKWIKPTLPAWEIFKDGSGTLANGHLTWDSNKLSVDGEITVSQLKKKVATEFNPLNGAVILNDLLPEAEVSNNGTATVYTYTVNLPTLGDGEYMEIKYHAPMNRTTNYSEEHNIVFKITDDNAYFFDNENVNKKEYTISRYGRYHLTFVGRSYIDWTSTTGEYQTVWDVINSYE